MSICTAKVEKLNGHLVVFIPLAEGGQKLRLVTKGLNDIEGTDLKIVFPGWLADALSLKMGSEISLDSLDGQLAIQLL